LKKAAVIGAGAYIGYKVTKATGKALKKAFGGREIEYDSWNTWRQRYGFLCKIDNHCNWLDRNLECQQNWIKPTGWTLSSDNPFGSQPTGQCVCQKGFVWDDKKWKCNKAGLGAVYIVVIVLGIIVILGIGAFIGKKVC
jgi:hypothetical protein